MPLLTGGEAVVQSLLACGIDTAFGIPGMHNLGLYDPVIRTPGIVHYLTRHEQAAVFMADGYFRTSGKIAAAFLTTGPGASNSVTAAFEAHASSVPVLLIISQVKSQWIDKGKGVIHELTNQLGLFGSITAWTKRITAVEEIPEVVVRAMETFRTEHPRPVAVEISTDLLDQKAEVAIPSQVAFAPPSGDAAKIREAADLLQGASRPVIYAGAGVMSAQAWAVLRDLAELLQAPVLTGTKGKGAFPEDHPLALGTHGVEEPVQGLLQTCDVGLAVGTRLSQLSTGGWRIPLPKALIQVDIDPANIGNTYPVQLGIVGDARLVLEALLQELRSRGFAAPPFPVKELARVRREIYEDWYSLGEVEMTLLNDIRSVLPPEAIVSFDLTMASYWARKFFRALQPRTFLYPMGSHTLGYAFPAALGAKIAVPNRPVVAICGDGGFLFTCQELATAAKYGLRVVVLLFNDDGLGIIQYLQDAKLGRHGEVDLVNPDFPTLAQAFGLRGMRIASLAEVPEALANVLAADRATLLEVKAKLKAPLRSYPSGL